MAPKSLNTKYGDLRCPQATTEIVAIKQWEQDNSPHSLVKLEVNSASDLMKLMEIATLSWKAGETILQSVNILWVVDEFGDIYFAIEELFFNIDDEYEDLNIPLPRYVNALSSQKIDKLGHPSLVARDDKHARIGGEIYLETRTGLPVWHISNKSGRYGFGSDRTEKHLNEAKRNFQSYGINLALDFV